MQSAFAGAWSWRLGAGENELGLGMSKVESDTALPFFDFLKGSFLGKHAATCCASGAYGASSTFPSCQRAEVKETVEVAGKSPVRGGRSGIAIYQIVKERTGGKDSRYRTFVHVQVVGRGPGGG
jgi:hypothetical protein